VNFCSNKTLISKGRCLLAGPTVSAAENSRRNLRLK